jgi:hypothetical protein
MSGHISAAIPAHLGYACQFWAHHIQAAPHTDILLREINDFVYNNLLYWLEVLSLIGDVNLASPALLKTAKWSRVSCAVCDNFAR